MHVDPVYIYLATLKYVVCVCFLVNRTRILEGPKRKIYCMAESAYHEYLNGRRTKHRFICVLHIRLFQNTMHEVTSAGTWPWPVHEMIT